MYKYDKLDQKHTTFFLMSNILCYFITLHVLWRLHMPVTITGFDSGFPLNW